MCVRFAPLSYTHAFASTLRLLHNNESFQIKFANELKHIYIESIQQYSPFARLQPMVMKASRKTFVRDGKRTRINV